MHPTSDEMLALRDGNADPEVVAHVNGCERCSGELGRLDELREGLRGLPQLQPPPGGWEAIREAVRNRQELRRRRRWTAVAAALIAGIALWLGSVGVFRRGSQPEVAGPADLEALIAASGQLERALRAPSLRERVLTPREAAQIVVIEDRIALIDLRLARPANEVASGHAVGLWSDRVELLDALVQARGGATSPAITRNASFHEERSWQ